VIDWRQFPLWPKAELHLHLEGSFSAELAARLAARQPQHPLHGMDARMIQAYCRPSTFASFIDRFRQTYRLLTSAADYQALAETMLERLEQNGVHHAEVLYAPGVALCKLGIPLREIHAGLAAAQKEFPRIRVLWILDVVSNLGAPFCRQTLEAVLADPPLGLAGFSVGGGDLSLQLEAFLPLFQRAQEAGLFLTTHAGEVDGPTMLAQLLAHTDLARIAHGLSLTADAELRSQVRRRGIALDICPSSNLCTAVVARAEDHPAIEFLGEGLCVTLNTDDPFHFQTDLAREYAYLGTWRLEEQLGQVLANSWRAAQVAETERQHRLMELQSAGFEVLI
jgi:adenosine deaminase